MEARGPKGFRFGELGPDEFEELCFLLARTEDERVRRLRAPDGGLDAAIIDDGVALRGWQAKRHARPNWTDIEGSLATAVGRHRVRRVTFCFPFVLTAPQRESFEKRLRAVDEEVELDYWDAGELTARLLDPRAEAVRERFFRQERSSPRPALNRQHLPALAAVGWQEMGVARGAFLADEQGWTTKLDRSVDRELAERLGDWRPGSQPPVRFVVLSGPPGSGKTRTLLDALRGSLPESALLLAPSDAAQAHEIAVGWHRLPEDDPRPVVLWLDDLERFLRLDESGLTRDGLMTLLGRDPQLLIAATCHGKGLSLLPPEERDIDTLLDTVVDAAGLHLRLDYRLSDADLEAAGQSGIEASALEEIGELGVGPYVLAIERLNDRVARATEPHYRALIEAALDWTASGIVDPIPRPTLQALWERRLAGEPSEERFREALDWAQEPLVGSVALIFREGQEYLAPPLLAAAHQPHLDAKTVAAVLELADDDQVEQIAATAAGSPATAAAITAHLEEVAGARPSVAGAFAVSMISSGEREAGVRWLRWAADRGDAQATRNLGVTLRRQGMAEEAQAAHERADELGDPIAATCLALHFLEQGKDEEAMAALRRADERGDADGSYLLADELLRRGSEEEARAALERAVDRGCAGATTALGAAIGNAGDHAGALELFRLAEERGDREGSLNLGRGLERIGDREGALAAYRRADRQGDPEGALHHGRLLLDEDDLDAALAALNRADERGSAEGAVVLGEVLGQLGLLDFAEAALRRADRRGSGRGALRLGELLAYWDSYEEAEAAFRRAGERREPGAAEALGMLLDQLERPEAQSFLERADLEGSAEAALASAFNLANSGELEAAEEAAARALERGSAEAGHLLGRLYLEAWEEPRFDEALEALRRAEELGSGEAALLLARVLRHLSRDPERADAALRRSEERGVAEAKTIRGALHLEAGELEAALECFAQAELMGDIDGAAGAAEIFLERKLPREAIEAMGRALAGGQEGAAVPLGNLLVDNGDFEQGLAILESAAQDGLPGAEQSLESARGLLDRLERQLRDREDPMSKLELGALQHCSGRLEEAIANYEIAAEAGIAEAAAQLGNIHYGRDDVERAIPAYRRAMEAGSGKAAFILGTILSGRGEAGKAREAWMRAESLGEGGGACQLGAALQEDGDPAAAEAAFRRAVDLGHGHGALMLAKLLRAQGRDEEAVEPLRRAEAMDEGEAATELGRILLSLGDREGAREAFSRDDRRGEAAAAFELGQMWLDDRDTHEAVGALRRAEARGHEPAMRLLVHVLNVSGRSRDAERVARRWHDRGNWIGSLQLATILTRRGEFGELAAIDEVLRERAPDSGQVQYLRGCLLLSAGDSARAVEPLRAAVEAGVDGAEHVAEFAELCNSDPGPDEWEKLVPSLCESDNPLLADAGGDAALEMGNLELAEKAFRRAFEHGDRGVGEKLAGVLDELGEPEEAREIRKSTSHLAFFDEPLLRPLQGAAAQVLSRPGMEWLHDTTVNRALGYSANSDVS